MSKTFLVCHLETFWQSILWRKMWNVKKVFFLKIIKHFVFNKFFHRFKEPSDLRIPALFLYSLFFLNFKAKIPACSPDVPKPQSNPVLLKLHCHSNNSHNPYLGLQRFMVFLFCAVVCCAILSKIAQCWLKLDYNVARIQSSDWSKCLQTPIVCRLENGGEFLSKMKT